ncbi:hypothetical protein [Paenibacillus graminis]|uniref:Uncharacterized protein n=1 Tax=Paenibacillus graminis TaxID=189425 RepID=A0A089M962_9BACL|nr:hypothetical protein [Paenibacillus graminis]AIQ70341.1 hypothetical protein PGRAT_23895 [Paenibacillus graminis]
MKSVIEARAWAKNVIEMYRRDMQEAREAGDIENAMACAGRISGVQATFYGIYGEPVNFHEPKDSRESH